MSRALVTSVKSLNFGQIENKYILLLRLALLTLILWQL